MQSGCGQVWTRKTLWRRPTGRGQSIGDVDVVGSPSRLGGAALSEELRVAGCELGGELACQASLSRMTGSRRSSQVSALFLLY